MTAGSHQMGEIHLLAQIRGRLAANLQTFVTRRIETAMPPDHRHTILVYRGDERVTGSSPSVCQSRKEADDAFRQTIRTIGEIRQ